MTTSQRLIAGNWKMNGLAGDLVQAQAMAQALGEAPAACRVALCPPATLIAPMRTMLAGSALELGGQDCSAHDAGAFTGDVSAAMLADAGARLVILGHSERRAGRGEDDALVAAKALAALRAGLEPVICVGETLEQRRAGQALEIVAGQIAGSVPAALGDQAFALAYEPIWAIGTGLTPTLDEIAAVHRAARAALVRALGPGGGRALILYGGSVKAANAAEILATQEVGGALVGGASLTAADFLPIVRAA